MLLVHILWPAQKTGMVDQDCSIGKIWAFPGIFPRYLLAWDYQADVATWMGLPRVAGGCFKTSPNSPSDLNQRQHRKTKRIIRVPLCVPLLLLPAQIYFVDI